MEQGYSAASVSEIAQRAGASKQTLYSRYSSKADLFKAVMLRMTERHHLEMSGMLVSNQPIEYVLEQFGDLLIERMLRQDSRRLMMTLATAANSFPELGIVFWEVTSRRGNKILADYLNGQIRIGKLRPCDPEVAAHVMFSLLVGRYLPPAQMGIDASPSLEERRAYIAEAIRVFMAAYGPLPPSTQPAQ